MLWRYDCGNLALLFADLLHCGSRSMKCPACGREGGKEWRQCGRFNYEPVCSNCCKKCGFYSSDVYVPSCLYSIEMFRIKERLEIIEKRQEFKKISQKYEAEKELGNFIEAGELLQKRIKLRNWLSVHDTEEDNETARNKNISY